MEAEPKPIEVLLIEDSRTDAMLVQAAIQSNGSANFGVTHVDCVSGAAELLKRQSFDVVLTDLNLPDSEGLETLRAVRRAVPQDVAIVILTSHNDEAVAITAVRQGAQDYLVKGQVPISTYGRAIRYALERTKLEVQLRQYHRMEAVGRLAGGIAHDFNNLLTVIRGHATLIQTGERDEDRVQESAGEICQAADRAAALTRQLLTFSRRQTVQPKRIDINHVLAEMQRILMCLVADTIRLELRLSPCLPSVLADAGMIEQLVMNLALNARDAMQSGGELVVSSGVLKVSDAVARQHPGAYEGEFVKIGVSDTGRGIEPSVMPRIFEPFFTTKEVGQGAGLGLATVYGIVREHRGWLKVHSEVGRGTVFEVFFPALPDVAEAPPLPLPPAPERIGGEMILVVEDETMLRNLAATILRRQGYEVLEAANAPEALEIWGQRKGRIDLVLTDIVMPGGITGRELGKRLQADRPGLRIIYTSGYSPETYDDGDFFVEGSNFLSKPYRSHDLLVAIRRSLSALA